MQCEADQGVRCHNGFTSGTIREQYCVRVRGSVRYCVWVMTGLVRYCVWVRG